MLKLGKKLITETITEPRQLSDLEHLEIQDWKVHEDLRVEGSGSGIGAGVAGFGFHSK